MNPTHTSQTGTAVTQTGPTRVRLCAPVTDDGTINPRFCQAARGAVVDVHAGRLAGWQEFAVGWDQLHGDGPHDEHHERMAAFLRHHGVNILVVEHIGTCLRATLLKMDIAVQANASGPAGEAIVSAAHDQLTR